VAGLVRLPVLGRTSVTAQQCSSNRAGYATAGSEKPLWRKSRTPAMRWNSRRLFAKSWPGECYAV